jgi:hypothetical protein
MVGASSMSGPHGLDGFSKVIQDGRDHEINEELFYYFLEVLPPVTDRMTYQGKLWDFGYAEGHENVTLFRREGDQFFARQIPWLNPREAGSIDSQKKRLIFDWSKIGKGNQWIRQANDPPFNTQSFTEVQSDAELLEKFKHGNWSLGQAFHIGDLCFIQQQNGGDEWLTIKGNTAFESISFGHIIESKGEQAAQEILDGIRAASVEECKKLNYGRGR